MIKNLLILIIGFGLLIKGSDIFVEGTSSIAKKLKVQQSFISKYESNDRKLDVLEFLKICQILNKNAVDVINDILSKINL